MINATVMTEWLLITVSQQLHRFKDPLAHQHHCGALEKGP